MSFWMIGIIGYHLRTHGRINSKETPIVWEEILKEATKDAGKSIKGHFRHGKNEHYDRNDHVEQPPEISFFFKLFSTHIFRFYDENQLPHGGPEPSDDRKRRDLDIFDRYDREDPAVGTKQITTGFRKWAERFLSACSGQRNYNYQVNRMQKWNNALQMHLANNSD